MISRARGHEFEEKGHRRRHFFAHNLYHLPKCAPDAFKLGERMCDRSDPGAHWELLMCAEESELAGLPADLFDDSEVLWHGQQFGLPGQIAWAGLIVDGTELFSVGQQSDLVQRIGRRPDCKTQVENRFKGWPRMLLHAILVFAAERGISTVKTPTAALAMRHTDRRRQVGPLLFERVYDHPVGAYRAAERDGWWTIDVEGNRELLVIPESVPIREAGQQTVCVCHDLERGLGHVGVDEQLRARADAEGWQRLERMLAVERAAGVRVTYNVVGALLPEVRDQIEGEGHCAAFHSYDHSDRPAEEQLELCRKLDYRLKGYRPPRSDLAELSERLLAQHNFEWLGSSAYSMDIEQPELDDRLVRLPIAIDDHWLYQGEAYEKWERRVLGTVRSQRFTALGLHDCYAPWWLDRYERLLDRLQSEARMSTMDEVSAEVLLSHAV